LTFQQHLILIRKELLAEEEHSLGLGIQNQTF